jgi:catechol 2,3-dioxygenase-like lactoylglutathione lyase family enzyme
MIEGLSHLTFIVRDLERMSRLIEDVLGGRQVYTSGDATFSLSREKFFIVAGMWIAIMEGDPLQSRTYNHVAFKIREQDLDGLKRRIEALGLDIREARARVEGEGSSSCTPARWRRVWRATPRDGEPQPVPITPICSARATAVS